MELITQKIRQCIEKVKDMSQVGFDRDYVIKDNKPDVSKVVCQNGQVKLDEIKASGENIWLSGSIEFEVLYTREEVFEGDGAGGKYRRKQSGAYKGCNTVSGEACASRSLREGYSSCVYRA